MQDFLRYLLTPLLSQPDQLSINQSSDNTLVIKVADDDVGRIIGKHGNIIQAIRTLAKTYSHLRKAPFMNIVLDTPAKKD